MQDFEDNIRMAEKRAEMLRYVQEIRRMREELDNQTNRGQSQGSSRSRDNIVKEWVENLPQETVTNSPKKSVEPRMAVPPVERGPSSETDDLSLGAEAFCLRNAQNMRSQPNASLNRTSLKRRQAWVRSRSFNKESFNSDMSAHTTMSQPSSIEQLLAGRRSDPEELLARLGFCTDSTIAGLAARIPPRFLQSQSAAQGINVNRYLGDETDDLSRPNSPAGKREYLQFVSLEDLLTYLVASGVPRRFMAPYIERYLRAQLQREAEEFQIQQKLNRSPHNPRRSPQHQLLGADGLRQVSPAQCQIPSPNYSHAGTLPTVVTVTPACVDVAMKTEDVENLDRVVAMETGPRVLKTRRLSRQSSMSIDMPTPTYPGTLPEEYQTTPKFESHFPYTEPVSNGPVQHEVTRYNDPPILYIAHSNRHPVQRMIPDPSPEPIHTQNSQASLMHSNLPKQGSSSPRGQNEQYRDSSQASYGDSSFQDCHLAPVNYIVHRTSVISSTHPVLSNSSHSNGTLVNNHNSLTRVTPSESFMRVTPSYRTSSSPIQSTTSITATHGNVTTIATVHSDGEKHVVPSPRRNGRTRLTGENALYCHKLKMMFSPQLPNSRRESFRRAMVRSESADNVSDHVSRKPLLLGRSFDSYRKPSNKEKREALSPERPRTLTFSHVQEEVEQNESSSGTTTPLKVNSLKRLHLSPDEALV